MRPEIFPGLDYLRVEEGELVEEAKRLEYRVFSELGYQGAGPFMTELEPYHSRFYVAVEDTTVVGSVRMATPTNNGLPTTDLATLDHDRPLARLALEDISSCEDPAASAVARGYRTRHRFACILNLYRLAYQDAVRKGVKVWVAIIDAALLPHFRNIFHFNFEDIGPPQELLGTLCIPSALDFHKGPSYMQKKDPELLDWFMEGL
jgi:hypothetical protein